MWTFNVTGLGLSAGNLRTDLLSQRLLRAREPAPHSERSWIRVPNGRSDSTKRTDLARKSPPQRLTQQETLRSSPSVPRRAKGRGAAVTVRWRMAGCRVVDAQTKAGDDKN